jgi:release factor glutamine methyltransferase
MQGIRYQTHPDVYVPADDTQLMLEAVNVHPGDVALDLGTGAGLVGIHMARLGARVLSVDANPQAVRLARENAIRNNIRLEAIKADLVAAVRSEVFDVIAFNPPYLPTAEGDNIPGALNRAFDGGRDGMSVTTRFLDLVAAAPPRRTFLLGSSLQGPPGVAEAAASRGMRVEVFARKNLSWETLTVYGLSSGEARTRR